MPGWAPGYIDGGRVEVTSATAVLVHPGCARDGNNTTDMDWRGGRNDKLATPDTIGIATVGALGLDQKQLVATCTTTNGNANYSSITADIFNELSHVLHLLSGVTMTTVSTAATFSRDVRGILHVGDLVGSRTTYGFSRLTAISNTGLGGTLVAALPGGDATTIAFSRLENLSVKAGSETSRLLNTITAAGTTIVASGNSGATASSITLTFGVEMASQYLAVFKVLLYTPGTGYSYTSILSTQRSRLLLSTLGTGVVTAIRRVGLAYNNSSGDLVKIRCAGEGAIRRLFFAEANAFTGSLLVNNGAPNATWTDVAATGIAPPSVVALIATVDNEGAAGKTLFVKPSDGVAWASMGGTNSFTIGGGNGAQGTVDVNRNQDFAYSFQAASGSAYLYLTGLVDDLTLWQGGTT